MAPQMLTVLEKYDLYQKNLEKPDKRTRSLNVARGVHGPMSPLDAAACLTIHRGP